MPGVHQRFVALDGTVKTLDRKIVSGFNKLDTKVDGRVLMKLLAGLAVITVTAVIY